MSQRLKDPRMKCMSDVNKCFLTKDAARRVEIRYKKNDNRKMQFYKAPNHLPIVSKEMLDKERCATM